ncbi:hypothetical protein [Campylobacter sputorum]|uniref:hypothetical protein n=1 Tax=Campylobacter sputorum TaxID=206 RepID=UPI00053BE42A|nr:hypothetical protein [Campylobacter sputorum]
MNYEAVLVQLGYTQNDASIQKIKRILSKCDLTDKELQHIVELNDKLKPYLSYITMSNSYDYFKIKYEKSPQNIKEDIINMIENWSDKYKIAIQKVENKETYYITHKI